MAFRFFRRIKILPGVSINLGKRGASVSVGPRGAKVTIGSKGVKTSVGLPGTGIRYEKKIASFGRGANNGGMSRSGVPVGVSPISVDVPPTKSHVVPHSNNTSSVRDELPPDEIRQLVEHCRLSRKYSRIITILLILFGGVWVYRLISGLIYNHVLGMITIVGFFVFLGLLLLRVVIRNSQLMAMDGFVPTALDRVAVALRSAFNSSRVWYSTTQSVGTANASWTDSLPFPMKNCRNVYAYNFGGVLLVPLHGFTILVDGLAVTAVPDSKVVLSVFRSSKTEVGHSPNPPDSRVIGRRWLHTTKKGLPDQRYNYNPCETTYQVGVLTVAALPSFAYWVTFSASSRIERLSEIIQRSNQQGYLVERPVRMRGTTGSDYFSMILKASSDLVDFLKRINDDSRSGKMLADIGGGETFDKFAQYCDINPRLTMLAYTDLRDTFRNLGYSTDDLTGPEGLGMLIVMLTLFSFEEVDVERLKEPKYASGMAEIISKCIRDVGGSMSIEGTKTPLMLHFILGHSPDGFDWAVEYATLVYRWASVMAKADGTITPAEQRVLTELMNLKEETSGSNVRTISGEALNVASVGALRTRQRRNASRSDGRMVSPSDRFNGLIGLKPVKDEVEKLARFVEIQRLRENKGMRSVPVSYHCVFTGNPGTGKTTVARIVAGIYKDLGVLKKGHLVETDRSGLVAEYVGQTAVKTNKVIDSALDGVLFIDEAYSLAEGGKEDYGKEAIATLLKRMEDDRDRLVVILAGYTREIKSFIDMNPGLQSRFNRYIEFPDYSAEELTQIFISYAKKSQYHLTASANDVLTQMMYETIRNKDKNFGNARTVRNLFERTIERQALRLSSVAPITSEMLETIELCDLEDGVAKSELTSAKAMDSFVEKTEDGRYVID